MSLLSWPVLLGAAILGSPALWATWVTGTLSPDVAGLRLLVCLVGSWAVLSLVARLAGGSTDGRPAAGDPAPHRQRPADVDLD
jgi:hypothetical protein